MKHAIERVLLLCITLLLLSGVAIAGRDSEAKALLARARDASNLSSKDALPYKMDVRFRALHLQAGDIDGRYTVYWKSDEESRIESEMGVFRESVVSRGEKWWRKSDFPFEPFAVSSVATLLRHFQEPKPEGLEGFGKIRKENVSGTPADCFEARDKYDSHHKYCVAEATGVLVRYEFKRSDSRQFYEYEYSDYTKVGSKWVPRRMSYTKNGIRLVDASIEAVEEWKPTEEALTPAEGAVERHSCKLSNSKPPKATYTPDPVYPGNPSKNGNQMVELRVLISAEGKLAAEEVQTTAGPDFDREALKSVAKWKFDPATCSGVPIEVEINIQINFRVN